MFSVSVDSGVSATACLIPVKTRDKGFVVFLYSLLKVKPEDRYANSLIVGSRGVVSTIQVGGF